MVQDPCTGLSDLKGAKMRMKPKCRVCKRYFLPNRRAGDRQKTCGDPACQCERHAAACKAWRMHNQDYHRKEGIRKKLFKNQPTNFRGLTNLHARINWDWVRDAFGVELAELLEEIVRSGNITRKTQ